jgi:hypothetical protein
MQGERERNTLRAYRWPQKKDLLRIKARNGVGFSDGKG